MSKFKRNFWMSTFMSGAMALMAGPAFGGPVIPSTSQQLDPNMPKHGMEQMQKQGKGMSAQAEGVSSMGKLQQADAHTLWLLHKINQSEIAAAQLAQAKSQNDKVKSLADDLLNDHKKLDDSVTKLAQDNNVVFEGAATGTGGAGLSGEEQPGAEKQENEAGESEQHEAGESEQHEKMEGQAGTGGSGAAGTTTGSMKENGDHAPAAPSEQQPQEGSKDVSKTGGSSTVEEVPNTGTGGSGSAGVQAQGSTAGAPSGAQVSGQAGTTGTGASATAAAEAPKSAGQPMKLSSSDRSFLEKGSKELQKLSKLQGSKFDREFLHAQIRDHQNAMKLLHAAKVQNEDLKKLVADAMPGMEKHEKDARDALRSLSGVGGSGEAGTKANVPSYAPNKPSTSTGTSDENQADQNAASTGSQTNGSEKGSTSGGSGR